MASLGPVGQVAAMDAEGGDAATWKNRRMGARPQFQSAWSLNNAGVRNGDMWQSRPRADVDMALTWQMTQSEGQIKLRHVAQVKVLTTELNG